jgi:epoxyqueuosine reductase
MTARALAEKIKAQAKTLGFDAVGITPAALPEGVGARLWQFLADGRHGDMAWLTERASLRAQPKNLWPAARSVIVLAMNYGPQRDPLTALEKPQHAAISVYAQNRDYHDILKNRLKRLAHWLVNEAGGEVKIFVDTAPVLEKPLAGQAGLGWQGKHTNLVSRQFGSWLFLGAVFSTLTLLEDRPETDHCGSCRACLDICPTKAFPAPYQLDARRCISYLTIEHKGPIPLEFRKAIGNRIYGCDDCLAVCPWNKFASRAAEAAFHGREDLHAAPLAELAHLDDAAFRAKFSGSPIKRTGRNRFIRNVLIAIGNSCDPSLEPVARARLDDESALVRGAAIWALAQLTDPQKFQWLRRRFAAGERDATVREEWAAAVINRRLVPPPRPPAPQKPGPDKSNRDRGSDRNWLRR